MADQTEPTWPRPVTMYETSDGKTFAFENQAQPWQRAIRAAELANRALDQGEELAAAYALFHAEAYSWPVPEAWSAQLARLAGITRKSQLVIEHWQCRETPGYQPCRINPDGSIHVAGHAGSWSGPYGSDLSLDSIVRYVEDTRRRLGRIPEAA